jgi:hypothetical protein
MDPDWISFPSNPEDRALVEKRLKLELMGQ